MTKPFSEFDRRMMGRALELARRGLGAVEPNPQVGCVIVRDGNIVGEGWHQRFGGPHAEVLALEQAGSDARGSDVYVTLEPCSHYGKTPPCANALIAAGVARVIAAVEDPFPQVAGSGFARLQQANISTASGLLQHEAEEMNAPYFKLVRHGTPWVIAKWAMSLDGKIATRTGASQWISCEASRSWVHELRGRMDGILVGRGTVEADDPLLTARPPGPRIATRVILDSHARLRTNSRLVQSVDQGPVLVVVTSEANEDDLQRLQEMGAEVYMLSASSRPEQIRELLLELGRRKMTNLLVEGGAAVLGSFFAANAIDEVHAFIAPKIIGGVSAASPVGGEGIADLADAFELFEMQAEPSGGDFHLFGRRRPPRS
jgi:diaminohydroxyphosphoribosylaminopyrimidine deaminase/5-amino-6-(5-phosphoribosylamino)uracil reductase